MLRFLTDKSYIDYGYMSTSKEMETTQGFYQGINFGYSPALLRIKIPKESRVLDLDKINGFENTTYESEILIKRKARFEVISNELITDNLENLMGKLVSQDFDNLRVLGLTFVGYLE